MFPENVERVVVDGVVNALDYYAGEYRTNLMCITLHYLMLCRY
jgi:hypothetical protein